MQILQKGPAASVKCKLHSKIGWERQTLRFIVLKRGFMDGQGLEAGPVERGGGRGPPLAPLGRYRDAWDGTRLAHQLMSPRPPELCVYLPAW